MLSPDPYTIFRLTPLLPLEDQRVRLTIATPSHTQQVSYWLDDQHLADVDRYPFDYWWPLLPGDHQVYAEVVFNDGSAVTTEVIPFRVGSWIPPNERPTSGVAE
jgi:hypothetical protein